MLIQYLRSKNTKIFLLFLLFFSACHPLNFNCLDPLQNQDNCTSCIPTHVLYERRCYEKMRGCSQYKIKNSNFKEIFCQFCHSGYLLYEEKCERKAVVQLKMGTPRQHLMQPAPVKIETQTLQKQQLKSQDPQTQSAPDPAIQISAAPKQKNKPLPIFPKMTFQIAQTSPFYSLVHQNKKIMKQFTPQHFQAIYKKYPFLEGKNAINKQFYSIQPNQEYKQNKFNQGFIFYQDGTVYFKNKDINQESIRNMGQNEQQQSVFYIPYNKQVKSVIEKIRADKRYQQTISASLSLNLQIKSAQSQDNKFLSIDLSTGKIHSVSEPQLSLSSSSFAAYLTSSYSQFLQKTPILEIPTEIYSIVVQNTQKQDQLLFNITYVVPSQSQKEDKQYAVLKYFPKINQTQIIGYFVQGSNVLLYFQDAAKSGENSISSQEKKIKEEEKLAQQIRIAEQKLIQQQKMVAQQKRKAQQIRIAQQKRINQQIILAEQKRLIQEAKIAQQRRLADEKRLAQQLKLAQQKRKAEEKRILYQKRLIEEKQLAQEKRIAEEKRILEEKRLAEEKIIAEQIKIAQQKRLAEQKRIVQQKRVADQKRVAQQKRMAQENRLAEQKRLAQQKKKLEQPKPTSIKTAEDAINSLKSMPQYSGILSQPYKIVQFLCSPLTSPSPSTIHKLKLLTPKSTLSFQFVESPTQIKPSLSQSPESCLDSSSDLLALKLDAFLRKSYPYLSQNPNIKMIVQLKIDENGQKYIFSYGTQIGKKVFYQVAKGKQGNRYYISKSGVLGDGYGFQRKEMENLGIKVSECTEENLEKNGIVKGIKPALLQLVTRFKGYIGNGVIMSALGNGTHVKIYVSTRFMTYQFTCKIEDFGLGKGSLFVVDQKYGYDVIPIGTKKQLVSNLDNDILKRLEDATIKKHRSYFGFGSNQLFIKKNPITLSYQLAFKSLLGYFSTTVTPLSQNIFSFSPLKKTNEFEQPKFMPTCSSGSGLGEILQANDKRCYNRIPYCYRQIGNYCVLCEIGFVGVGGACRKVCN